MKNWYEKYIPLAVALTVIAGYFELFARETLKGTRPNIIFIMADDAGYGDFGCYGQKDIQTPEIDAMAQEGVLFTRHYAAAPVCAPSRCGLLTGFHTGHTVIRGNHEVLPEGQMPLPAGTTTLGTILKKAGYHTAVIGKWGLGGPGTTGIPTRQGFDYFFGYLCQRQAHNYYPDHLWENERQVKLNSRTWSHKLVTQKALDYIKKRKDKPFFLYLPYTVPHAKLQVPDTGIYKNKPWQESMKKYAAMITSLDRDVGRIKKLLKRMGIDRNTLVIITSDNGPHREGGASPAFFNSAGSLRGIKRSLYEGGTRVPFIAWWPGHVPAGTTSNHVSAFWDMLPTFAELAGEQVPEKTDGISLLHELSGNHDKQAQHDYLYWEFHELGGHQAVTFGKWKAVRHGVRYNTNAPVELYNLDDDLAETQNLAAKKPGIAARAISYMDTAHTFNKYFPLVGKTRFAPGLYNGWIFAAPFILALLAVSIIRRRLPSFGRLNLVTLSLRFAARTGIVVLATLLPVWFVTWRGDMAIYLGIVLLALYLSAGIASVFRSWDWWERILMILEILFWAMVSVATHSTPMMFLVLFLSVVMSFGTRKGLQINSDPSSLEDEYS